jgi:hypothetical protein
MGWRVQRPGLTSPGSWFDPPEAEPRRVNHERTIAVSGSRNSHLPLNQGDRIWNLQTRHSSERRRPEVAG